MFIILIFKTNYHHRTQPHAQTGLTCTEGCAHAYTQVNKAAIQSTRGIGQTKSLSHMQPHAQTGLTCTEGVAGIQKTRDVRKKAAIQSTRGRLGLQPVPLLFKMARRGK